MSLEVLSMYRDEAAVGGPTGSEKDTAKLRLQVSHFARLHRPKKQRHSTPRSWSALAAVNQELAIGRPFRLTVPADILLSRRGRRRKHGPRLKIHLREVEVLI